MESKKTSSLRQTSRGDQQPNRPNIGRSNVEHNPSGNGSQSNASIASQPSKRTRAHLRGSIEELGDELAINPPNLEHEAPYVAPGAFRVNISQAPTRLSREDFVDNSQSSFNENEANTTISPVPDLPTYRNERGEAMLVEAQLVPYDHADASTIQSQMSKPILVEAKAVLVQPSCLATKKRKVGLALLSIILFAGIATAATIILTSGGTSDSLNNGPTVAPTLVPNQLKTSELHPSDAQSEHPLQRPTTSPSALPSFSPSKARSTPSSPVKNPTSVFATDSPTLTRSALPTIVPSSKPTIKSSPGPTVVLTLSPTGSPTHHPSVAPTPSPTKTPTSSPTAASYPAPTKMPTFYPTAVPNPSPTRKPTLSPTAAPSVLTVQAKLQRFMSTLPPETQTAINNPASPQGQAAQWLVDSNTLLDFGDQKITQRFVLATLYFATTGTGWRNRQNWLTSTDECSWYNAATTPCESGTLRNLVLLNNRLNGKIPPELGLLSLMRSLDFGRNTLTGTIPPGLGMLNQLTSLKLYTNTLTGSIPSTFRQLSSLQQLWMYENLLSGTLPTGLQRLTDLVDVQIDANYVSGHIPATMFHTWPQLMHLDLGNNEFNGTLPSSIGSLVQLTYLDAYFNILEGSLPTTLGLLVKAQEIYLEKNAFSGLIPSTLGLLSNLSVIYLHDNGLSGTVPQQLCTLVRNNGLELSIDCSLVTCNCGCRCDLSSNR